LKLDETGNYFGAQEILPHEQAIAGDDTVSG
jgi:hypothetical protein